MVMVEVGYYYSELEGLEVILTQGQGRFYPWHMHARHWTVGIVRRGGIVLAVSGGAQRLTVGQSFCLRPWEPHSLRVEPGSVLLVACFDAQSLLLLGEGSDSSLPSLFLLNSHERVLMEEAFTAHGASTFLQRERGHSRSEHDEPLVLAIRELSHRMLETPGDILPIDRMAAYAGYSPWHFLRAFLRVTGMTPHAFQVLCRLRLLRSLLRADTAAADAAVSAGFVDQSHMHKAFKRHHGLTPGEFQRASIRLALR